LDTGVELYALVERLFPLPRSLTGEGVRQTLSVLAEERGRGVGTQLMDAVEDELLQRGISELRLLVIAPNAEAIRFYERRGLTTVSQVMLGRIGCP